MPSSFPCIVLWYRAQLPSDAPDSKTPAGVPTPYRSMSHMSSNRDAGEGAGSKLAAMTIAAAASPAKCGCIQAEGRSKLGSNPQRQHTCLIPDRGSCKMGRAVTLAREGLATPSAQWTACTVADASWHVASQACPAGCVARIEGSAFEVSMPRCWSIAEGATPARSSCATELCVGNHSTSHRKILARAARSPQLFL
jgi:hypothetical protein